MSATPCRRPFQAMMGIRVRMVTAELTATYLSCGDHDANLLDGFGELIRLDGSVIVEVEVLEGLEEDGLFVGVTGSLL